MDTCVELSVYNVCISALEGICTNSVCCFVHAIYSTIDIVDSHHIKIREHLDLYQKLGRKEHELFSPCTVNKFSEDTRDLLFDLYDRRFFHVLFDEKLAHLCDIVCFVYSVYVNRYSKRYEWYRDCTITSTFPFIWKLLHLYKVPYCKFEVGNYCNMLVLYGEDEKDFNEIAALSGLLLNVGTDRCNDSSFFCYSSDFNKLPKKGGKHIYKLGIDY